jgi:general stress protein 26
MRNPGIAALATVTKEGKPRVRYVIASTDEQLSITIGTSKLSKKCADVLNHPMVHLCYKNLASEADIEYVQIEGKASILSDSENRSRFWSPMLWLYFSGPQDPNYAVLSIKTQRAELWNVADLKLEMAPLVWEP